MDLTILNIIMRSIAGGFAKLEDQTNCPNGSPYELLVTYRLYGTVKTNRAVMDFEPTLNEVQDMIEVLCAEGDFAKGNRGTQCGTQSGKPQ